jgi:hypothetical protein
VDHSNYLISVEPPGEKTSERVGARLWNLDKLSQDWAYGRGEDPNCTKQIYEQAIADADEYWKMIGEKYGCGSGSSGNEVCTRKHGYRDSMAFIDTVKHVLSMDHGYNCNSAGGGAAGTNPADGAVRDTAKNVTAVVKQALGNVPTGGAVETNAVGAGAGAAGAGAAAAAAPKAAAKNAHPAKQGKGSPELAVATQPNVAPAAAQGAGAGAAAQAPAKDAAGKPDIAGATPGAADAAASQQTEASTCSKEQQEKIKEESIGMWLKGCGPSFVVQLYNSLKDFIQSLIRAGKNPSGTISALVDFAKALLHHPENVIGNIIAGYTEALPDTACMSSIEKGDAYCKVGAKILFDIGLIMSPGATVKISATLIKDLAFAAGKFVGRSSRVGGLGAKMPKFVKNGATKAVNATKTATSNTIQFGKDLKTMAGILVEQSGPGTRIIKAKNQVLAKVSSIGGRVTYKPTSKMGQWLAGKAKSGAKTIAMAPVKVPLWVLKRVRGLPLYEIKEEEPVRSTVLAVVFEDDVMRLDGIYKCDEAGKNCDDPKKSCDQAKRIHLELADKYKLNNESRDAEFLSKANPLVEEAFNSVKTLIPGCQ